MVSPTDAVAASAIDDAALRTLVAELDLSAVSERKRPVVARQAPAREAPP